MSETVERERLDVDILFVGAGAATLSSVIRLADLCKAQNLEMPAVLVIEKAPEVGGHQLSGAMMDPRGLAELMPDFVEQGFPFHYQCTKDYTWIMTKKRVISSPVTPPPFTSASFTLAAAGSAAKAASLPPHPRPSRLACTDSQDDAG